MVTVEQSKQLLKIFHKCVMLYAPEIERHKEADAVESQAGGECNFLCGIAECVFMVVFLQKPHGAVHSSAWDEVKAGDPRLLFVPRPDLVLGPFSFHGRFLLILKRLFVFVTIILEKYFAYSNLSVRSDVKTGKPHLSLWRGETCLYKFFL